MTDWPQVNRVLPDTIKAINARDWKAVGRLLADTGNPLIGAVLILAATQSAHCEVAADVVLNNANKFSSNS